MKAEAQSMQKTRFKDWLVKDRAAENSGSKAGINKDTPLKSAASGAKEERRRDRSASESSERYDPLADSDASSAQSDSPPRLSNADI